MITAVVIILLVGLGVGTFGGFKYGHAVASKAAEEAAKLQKAAKDIQ